MRIYQVNIVCGSGSTGRIAVDLSKVIAENDGECRIAYGRGAAPQDISAFCISKKTEVYHHAIMTRLTGKHGLYSKRATKRLIRDIEEYAPDIVHLHNIHGYYVNYEMLFGFLKTYGKPIVWTMHDCWAFTGQCAHYESVGCNKWSEGGCRACHNLKSYPQTVYGGNVEKNFRKKRELFTKIENLTIVTPSEWLNKQVSKSFLQEKKCVHIPNGIDLQVFQPKESNLREKLQCTSRMILLGVASIWTWQKGFDDMLLLREKLDDKYLIVLVGVTLKQKKKLPKGIVGIERTESVEELAKYYSAANLFLNLTYEDTFPTTNIEALACGTPVLTYRTGGSPEIPGMACGITVEKGDVDAVAEAIKNHSKQNAISRENCMERARIFEKSDCYKKYVEVYEGICFYEDKRMV